MRRECPSCHGSGETPARTFLAEKVIRLLSSFISAPTWADRNSYAELTTGLAGRAPGDIIGHDSLDCHHAKKKIIAAAGLDPETWGICPECGGEGWLE